MFQLQMQSESFKKGQVVRDSRDGFIYTVVNPEWGKDNMLTLDIVGDVSESMDGFFHRDYRYLEILAESLEDYRKRG